MPRHIAGTATASRSNRHPVSRIKTILGPFNIEIRVSNRGIAVGERETKLWLKRGHIHRANLIALAEAIASRKGEENSGADRAPGGDVLVWTVLRMRAMAF